MTKKKNKEEEVITKEEKVTKEEIAQVRAELDAWHRLTDKQRKQYSGAAESRCEIDAEEERLRKRWIAERLTDDEIDRRMDHFLIRQVRNIIRKDLAYYIITKRSLSAARRQRYTESIRW